MYSLNDVENSFESGVKGERTLLLCFLKVFFYVVLYVLSPPLKYAVGSSKKIKTHVYI